MFLFLFLSDDKIVTELIINSRGTMSHFSTVRTQYSNKKLLIQSLQQMGLNVIEHPQPVQLQTGWNSQAIAHLVVDRAQIKCGSDIGFIHDKDTYQLICDDYDLQRSSLPNFKQQLGTNYAIATAQKLGYRVLGQQNLDQQIKITLGARR
jgi:hypothetical protein